MQSWALLREALSRLPRPLERLIDSRQRVTPTAAAEADKSPATDGGTRTALQRHVRLLAENEVAELVEHYKAGATMNQLARRFGMHRGTVRAQLERQGVQIRHGSSFPAELLPEAIRLYEAGNSTAKVGVRLGLTPRVVLRALQNAGVALRSKSGHVI